MSAGRKRDGRRSQPQLRIVAGELRGRRLRSPQGEVRPTAQRTREAIFSMLGPEAVEGAVVLDLFCGSGALAIEALSRGAQRATLVDSAIEPAAANARQLDLGDRIELLQAVLPAAIAPGGRLAGRRFDLVFCDPPYRLAARLGPELDSHCPDLLATGGLLIVESPAADPIELTLPALRRRAYGAAHVAVYAAPEPRS